jgi:hypothetical protein
MKFKQSLRIIVNRLPIIKNILDERRKLRVKISELIEEIHSKDEIIQSIRLNDRHLNIFLHARPNKYNYDAVFDHSNPPEKAISRILITRINNAFLSQYYLYKNKPNDMWSFLTSRHNEIVQLLNTNIDGATAYLNKLFTTPLATGFNQGDTVHESLRKEKSSRDWTAQHSMDKLCGLAEALGCIHIENPEQGSWGETLAKDPDYLLNLISEKIGVDLKAPKYQLGTFGLKTKRGLFTERDFYAIFLANKISNLLPNKLLPICEIGGGAGLLTYYLWLFGFRNITLIDLPTVNIAQAYYLGVNLPNCNLTLSGEEEPFNKNLGIKILTSYYFSKTPNSYFELTVNVDSFPEISSEILEEYLHAMHKNTKLFLSVNQEASQHVAFSGESQLIVHQQIKKVSGFKLMHRHPFWLRKGYAEELYKIEILPSDDVN